MLSPEEKSDFQKRWLSARKSALSSVFSKAASESEIEALSRVVSAPTLLIDALLRMVFDNSRALGKSMSRYYQRNFSSHEITEILKNSNSPCLGGTWKSAANSENTELKRNGCSLPKASHICDYWREALDGLVMGLGDDARFVRIASVGHNDSFCHDRLYSFVSGESLLGPVPQEIENLISDRIARWKAQGVNLVLKGFSEQTLYFTVALSKNMPCKIEVGDEQGVEHGLRRLLPHINIVNMTPRAVIS